jgi:hypothetical protein
MSWLIPFRLSVDELERLAKRREMPKVEMETRTGLS